MKPIKLTQKQLRHIITEVTTADDPALLAHLSAQSLTDEDAENANNAATALDQVVRLFYKTPWEGKLYAVQGILSAIVTLVEKEQTKDL